MFRAALVISSIFSAVAFAPSTRVSRSVVTKMAFESEVGALPPVGFWDPLGLVADGDEAKFTQYREAELKHGRVAMLAIIGYLTQEYYKFPGTIDGITKFSDIPNGVSAIGVVPSLGWLQITALIGYWELIGWEDRKPASTDFGVGDFGFYTWLPKTPEQKKEFLTKEIQNGRLAMLGIMELLTHDIAKPAGEGLFVFHHF